MIVWSSLLLIVPEGIEIHIRTLKLHILYLLLIVPEGIEIHHQAEKV